MTELDKDDAIILSKGGWGCPGEGGRGAPLVAAHLYSLLLSFNVEYLTRRQVGLFKVFGMTQLEFKPMTFRLCNKCPNH